MFVFTSYDCRHGEVSKGSGAQSVFQISIKSNISNSESESRAPQAGAKKVLRISYITEFLYFALVLQSRNKYLSHEDTVNVDSWMHFLAAHSFENGQCVFSNLVRHHANKTNI